MNILAFCFFPAFVPPSNGGVSRLFNFYKALGQSHQVTLLTSGHQGVEEEVICHGTGFVERRIPKGSEFSSQWAEIEMFSGGGDLSGPSIAACGKYPTLLHQAYLDEYEKADVIIHDSPFTIAYDLFAGMDNKLRVYNSYNCETQLYEQMHEGKKSQPIRDIVRSSELQLLQVVDLLMFCSHDDLTTFGEMVSGAKYEAVYVPNGMIPISPRHTPAKLNSGRFSAIFMGSAHPPNVSAANFIVKQLAPGLPEMDFHIIGSCLPEGKYPANVVRHGIVDDNEKARLLNDADIALNPMKAGSGSNVKVLDYFSYALPVLSTLFGMRGIEAESDRHYLEAPLEYFVTTLHELLNQRDRLIEIGLAARDLGVERYTWDAIARVAAEKLEAMFSDKSTQDSRFVLVLNDYDSFSGTGGGCTRTCGLYKAVSDWSNVVFVCFSANGELSVRRHADGIYVISVPKTSEHLADLTTTNSRFRVSADDIVASRHCTSNPWLISIYKNLRERARRIVAEHCYMVPLPLALGDRFVYSSQNNETELKTRLLEWHPDKETLLKQVWRIERQAVEEAAAIIAVSEDDAESLVRGKQTAGPVLVVRNGAGEPVSGRELEAVINKVRSQIEDPSVLFLGSGHMPNVDAARYILEHIAPKCANVQFNLVGSVCDSLIKSAPKNVRLWGILDDAEKSAVMQSCTFAINPMLSGSGSNVKVADYLGHGLYVVSTEFGQRGYPASIADHVLVTSVENFVGAIQSKLKEPALFAEDARSARRELFYRELEMDSLAKRFVDIIKRIEVPKKRLLFVTYRYTNPLLGGAEINIEKFIRALGNSDQFDIDVITPEISGIHNHMRFSETYTFDQDCSAPIDIPNVRFARFPAEQPHPLLVDKSIRSAWRVQPRFEKAVSRQLSAGYVENGLTWGWGYSEDSTGRISRWAMAECGLFLSETGAVRVSGYAPAPSVITATSQGLLVGGPWMVDGDFCVDFEATAGDVEFSTSVPKSISDPRPIAFLLNQLNIAGKDFELANPTLLQRYLPAQPAQLAFSILDQAAEKTRVADDVRLTDGRGPWSVSMERFIADHVADYDLVVTHNNVFRPAVVAIQEAKKNGVPSILIPHTHLDDDFYHFPDLLQSARDASLVLAVPKAACDFLASKGCNVSYLPAGCDTTEIFSPQDIESFRKVFSSKRPFILVLGRKAGAKGYQKIIGAVEQLNRDGLDLDVVLIGPDDDGLSVVSQHATYLGRQPREVVRGALMSCLALCNMSVSESFGIVLLEAWLAGKPVIVNKYCAAFHDMAVDGVNALLVDDAELPMAIRRLLFDSSLQAKLAKAGILATKEFDWCSVSERFIKKCIEIVKDNKKLDGIF